MRLIFRHFLLLFLLVKLSLSSFAQKSFYTGFEKGMDKYYPVVEKDEAIYVMDLQKPQWAEGISGLALDLSMNAVLRKPLVLDSIETPDYTVHTDLSVQVWIKTIPGAPQGTPIVGNKKDGDLESKGWSIFTQTTGAWAVNLSDGKNTYSYKANAPQQIINDGNWHHLAFSINRAKEEVWFYLDGRNVAIYNVQGLGSLENEHATVVGGTDEYWEYGSNGQWTAFNGYLDEVSIQNSFINKDDIKKSFERFGQTKPFEVLNSPLRVMVWNIWHGGRRYGKQVGVQRVIETIKEAQPDVIGLIETYGSGEVIADSLGYHFYLISSNLSIMSRFPIKETIKAFRPFNFGGVRLDLGENRELLVLDTWLHYLPDYASGIVDNSMSSQDLVLGEKDTRHAEVKSILMEIDPLISKSGETPIIMLGDFNVGSHLDWTEATKQIHYGYTIDWPVSKEMENAGFKDSFRELHKNALLDPGLTWTPRAATSSSKYGLRDRIDYIYFQGGLDPIESKVIDYHPIMFPSDHAAVITVFNLK
ncbi:hypothetical protein GCM10028791_27370 [Echinicola sediminis]